MEREKYMEFEKQLDFKELIYIMRKRILLVWLLPVLCAAAAAAVSFFVLKPVYQANVSIIIGKGQGSAMTPSDVMMYQDLIKTYTEIANSNLVAEKAADFMDVKINPEALKAGLSVSSQAGTQVLTMSVQSGQPQEAVNEVEALARAFLQESGRLLPSANVDIIDHAKLPQSPVKPNKLRNITIGFAAGLISAIALALLLEYMKDTIKSEEDVKRYLGVSIIGVIPRNA